MARENATLATFPSAAAASLCVHLEIPCSDSRDEVSAEADGQTSTFRFLESLQELGTRGDYKRIYLTVTCLVTLTFKQNVPRSECFQSLTPHRPPTNETGTL